MIKVGRDSDKVTRASRKAREAGKEAKGAKGSRRPKAQAAPKEDGKPKASKSAKPSITARQAKAPKQPESVAIEEIPTPLAQAPGAAEHGGTFLKSAAESTRAGMKSTGSRGGGLDLPPILQANVFDTRGGAARIAWQLHQTYLAAEIEAYMAVGIKFSDDPRVLVLPNDDRRGPWAGPLRRLERELVGRRVRYLPGLARGLSYLAEPSRFFDARAGREDFHYPATRELLSLPPRKPGILHAHVLHSGWFDLRELPSLSQALPTVVTMHDEWFVTGHCAYAMDCERFRFGCGNCPDLQTYPPVKRDATGFNWKRKHNILRRANLYVAAPSRWLLDRLLRAYPPFEPQARVVRNGVDLRVFRPAGRPDDRLDVRAALGLADDDKVVLYMAHGGKDNARKGFGTVKQAFLKAAANASVRTGRHVLLCLGSGMAEERGGNWVMRSAGFVADMAQVARYYQAADVFLHAALQDNYPNTVLEAQACGTPVVATGVGGVPEQVDDGRTGNLVPAGDAEAMAARLCALLDDEDRRRAMGESAARTARERHGLERMAREYLDWYAELLDKAAYGQGRP